MSLRTIELNRQRNLPFYERMEYIRLLGGGSTLNKIIINREPKFSVWYTIDRFGCFKYKGVLR